MTSAQKPDATPDPEGSLPRFTVSRAGAPALTPPPPRVDELMAFRAPYLETKLLASGLARDAPEAAALVEEVKKYMAISARNASVSVPMFSARIDAVWHQFVLFTRQYAEFCESRVGRFLHHEPSESPAQSAGVARTLTFDEFRAAYEDAFGALSESWFDDRALDPATRLGLGLAYGAKALEVQITAGKAELLEHERPPRVLCRVQARAERALRFMLEMRCFLVRELPGLRGDAERLDLCRPLVRVGLLRIVP